jgi:hypothetical protein
MPFRTSDWNQNHGVGQTLLENWVEERAVGDLILEDRNKPIALVSRSGHKVFVQIII